MANNKFIPHTKLRFFKICLLGCLLSGSAFGQVSKGFKLLEKNQNLPQAESIFKSSIATDTDLAAAHYGLSLLYTNPAFNQPDPYEAFAQWRKAESYWQQSPPSDQNRQANKFNLSAATLQNLRQNITNQAFAQAQSENSLAIYERFLKFSRQPLPGCLRKRKKPPGS
ncbi:MAG: hypothetical protein HC880_17520 [Bacteroidia bacterium]|nr:hypothetical protein [Bacteroidia bacterium]